MVDDWSNMSLKASCSNSNTRENNTQEQTCTVNTSPDNTTDGCSLLMLISFYCGCGHATKRKKKNERETSKLYNGTGRVDSVWPRERDEGCLLHLKTTSAPDSTMSESLLNEEVCSRWRSAAIYSAKEASGPVGVMEATDAEGLWLLECLLHHLNQIHILILVR